MSRNLSETLASWLKEGVDQMGQVAIRSNPDGFELTHIDDVGRPDLTPHTNPNAARALSIYDDSGVFRPLKTAPSLRHGWKILAPKVSDVRLALEGFYPAMLGTFADFRNGTLAPTPLRDTLNRQSGMYACTKKLTPAQADAMVGEFCAGCLKFILWPLEALPADRAPQPSKNSIPLLCAEACNLLVAKAREVVKSSPA